MIQRINKVSAATQEQQREHGTKGTVNTKEATRSKMSP